MNTSIRALALLCVLTVPVGAFAQQVTLGHLLDAEAQLTLKKMHTELNKSEGGERKTEIILPPIGPIVPQRPETLSVYGTNNTYEAEVKVNGGQYSVRTGSRVDDYTVSAITPQGVELTRFVSTPAKRGKKQGASSYEKVTVFAPLNLR